MEKETKIIATIIVVIALLGTTIYGIIRSPEDFQKEDIGKSLNCYDEDHNIMENQKCYVEPFTKEELKGMYISGFFGIFCLCLIIQLLLLFFYVLIKEVVLNKEFCY